MNNARIKELRAELEAERIDLAELAEIEDAFAQLPDSALRDRRENAMASDMLDELEAAARIQPKRMRTATLQITVEFDESVTDIDSIASAADTLIETALSTPGILDEYGNPQFGSFEVAPFHD